jgi:S-DNA-T family DNA segregation ATPase FtsK/SpoIIIE
MAKKNSATKSPKKGSAVTITTFTKDERIKVLLGLFTISLSIYMLVAFVSYLFTWQIDQSKLDISFFELFKDATISVENWAGKLGAMMAHKFMFDWFGIASFSLVFLLGLLGIRLLKFRLLPFRKTLKYVLVFSIWLSIALGFIFHNSSFLPGGAHGYFISEWLNTFIGKVGTFFVVLISFVGFLTYAFDSFIGNFQNLIKSIAEAKVNDKALDNKTEQIDDNFDDEAKFDEEFPDEKEIDNFEDDAIEKVAAKKPEKEEKAFSFEYAALDEDEEVKLNIDEKELPANTEFLGLDNIEMIEIRDVENDNENDIDELEKDVTNNGTEFELDIIHQETEEDAPVDFIRDQPLGDYDPTLDLSNYKLPPLELLVEHNSGDVSVSEDELHSNKNRIV